MCDHRGLAIAVAVCAAWGSAHAQGTRPIRAAGVGTDFGWSPNKGFDLRLQFRIKNFGKEPATVTRSGVLMVFEGGWSNSQGETIAASHNFLGDSPTFAPGEERSYDWRGTEGAAPSHWLLAVQVSVAGRPAYEDMIAVPYHRPGFAAPPLTASGPLFIGLQEPVEVMGLTSGEVWLPVIGKVTNLTGKPLTLTKWRFHVKDQAGKVALDRDASGLLKVEKSKETLSEFYHGFVLPDDFRKGTLRIDAEVEVDGKKIPLVREVPAVRIEGYSVASPVEGPGWGWGGGPGCPGFHGHLHDPASRYSEDIGLFHEINGEKVTFAGDPNKNESFFGWNQPIHCVGDGQVIIVVDKYPENFGRKRNEANVNLDNNCLFVEHPGGYRSVYYHIRQGSATVKVGDRVKAGQVLARLGNAGSSSEPHLHFGYVAFDRHLGYHKNVPVRIKDLKTPDGKRVEGIIKDGFYNFTAAKPQ